jgi:hypothetical protein
MVVGMKMVFFWIVAPCSLVEVYQRFKGQCYLHHQSDYPRLVLQLGFSFLLG